MSERQIDRVFTDERSSPPRRNGELLFDALWESRIFGLTMTLYEARAFEWHEFRAHLIQAIDASERAPNPRGFRYWACWLDAFEALAADKGLCTASALSTRVAELEARPAGHDH